jgi:hypothetical protein
MKNTEGGGGLYIRFETRGLGERAEFDGPIGLLSERSGLFLELRAINRGQAS